MKVPINLVGFLGGFVCIASIVLILYFVIMKLAFGAIMVTLSILGNYIWRCYEAVKRKPPFIVEDEAKHEKEPV